MAKIYVKKGELKGKVFEISGELVFGRLKSCQITIRDEKLSRKHTRIYSQGKNYFVEDMKSRNGTYLNGKKIQSQQLHSGDSIVFGHNELIFEPADEGHSRPALNLEGQKVQNYQIQTRVFESPLFLWHQGWQKSLDRQVSLQALNPNYGAHKKIQEKVLQWARSAVKISHPQLMEILDVFPQSDSVFIWVEHLDGLFLKEAFQAGRMPLERMVNTALEITSLLAYLHEQKIVHASVDPLSIFLSAQGTTKITSPRLSPWTLRIRLQGKASSLLLPYTAPEIWQGQGPEMASDLYSLGIVLFQGLMGRLPFGGTTRKDLKKQHLHSPLPSLEKSTEKWPPKLELLLQGLTAKDPSERLSARLAHQHLQDIQKSLQKSTTTPLPPQSSPQAIPVDKIPSKRLKALPSRNFSKGEAILFSVFLVILFFLSSGITQLLLTIIQK